VTKEKILDSQDIPFDIHPQKVELVPINTQTGEGYTLHIQWSPDGHVSEFPTSFLSEHAYARYDQQSSNFFAVQQSHLEVDYGRRDNRRVAEIIQQYGAVVVRNGPTTPQSTLHLVELFGGRLIESHFGSIEDLKVRNTTNKNNDQLGYTNAAVRLHTDQPFIPNTPSMQLLHCIEPSECGGGLSSVSDGFAVARYLRHANPTHFMYLSSVPIHFHRRQKSFESLVVAPIIQTNSEGEIVQIRSSYFTMDPLRLPFNQMMKWYEAYRAFTALVRSPRFEYSFLLKSGDFVIYDNFRMLHGRTEFRGTKRWLRGVYLDKAEVFRHLTHSINE